MVIELPRWQSYFMTCRLCFQRPSRWHSLIRETNLWLAGRGFHSSHIRQHSVVRNPTWFHTIWNYTVKTASGQIQGTLLRKCYKSINTYSIVILKLYVLSKIKHAYSNYVPTHSSNDRIWKYLLRKWFCIQQNSEPHCRLVHNRVIRRHPGSCGKSCMQYILGCVSQTANLYAGLLHP